jgi:hypothetical protein
MGIGKFLIGGWTLAVMVMQGALVATKFSFLTLIPAVWGFSAALMANPITWVVLGITALVGVVAAAIIYWDEWTGALVNWGGQFMEAIGLFALVDSVVAAWDKLPQWWAGFKNWLGSLDPFSFIGTSLDWISNKIGGFADWLGIDLNVGSAPVAPKPVAAPESMNVNAARAQGGAIQQISNANNQRSVHIEKVEVNNSGQAMDGQTFKDQLEMWG